ncbi:MAG: immune inhibitor A [Anaerolineae bacterium]
MRGIVVLLLMALAVFVQAAPSPYPTLDALQMTDLPPADAVDLAVRLRGVTLEAAPIVPVERVEGMVEPMRVTRLTSEDIIEIAAELRVIGEHVYMWVEQGLPIPDAELRGLAAFFDESIYAPVRALWGSEPSPGIDGDVRVHILFARDLGSGTGAYFARRHMFPESVFPGSNMREMFFVNYDAYGALVNSPTVRSTLAHEFQHMIRDNVDTNEAGWLDEGLSVFTEHLLGFRDAASTANAFLLNPAHAFPMFGQDGSITITDYGASFAFVTYFHDRYGLEALVDLTVDSDDGLAAFDAALDGDMNTFFADWVLANLIQDTSIADGRYGYTSLSGTLPVHIAFRADRYPYTLKAEANQYATHYATLENLPDVLTLTLDVPAEVPLIPAEAVSGDWMWYSHRGDVTNSRLTRAFDLSAVDAATLTYQVWYDLETDWDYAYVSVSADDGQTWTLLTTPHMTTRNPHGNAYGSGYTGTSAGWQKETISLDAYAGQNVLVRFETVTDDAVNLPGMALDNIAVPEIGYFSDVEAEEGGWMAEGWLRMDNRLPQQMWVQAVVRSPAGVEVVRWQATGRTTWSLPIAPDVQSVTLAISPFALVTTVPAAYTLTVE